MERLASGTGKAVKFKFEFECHQLFVLFTQMHGAEPKRNFSCRQKGKIKPNVGFSHLQVLIFESSYPICKQLVSFS